MRSKHEHFLSGIQIFNTLDILIESIREIFTQIQKGLILPSDICPKVLV